MSNHDPGTESVPMAECYRRFDWMKFLWQEHQQSSGCRIFYENIGSHYIFTYFEKKVLPSLQVNFDHHWGRFVAERWLLDFKKTTGGFVQSLALYTKEPLSMATRFNSFVELEYCRAIIVCHMEDISNPVDFEKAFGISLPATEKPEVSNLFARFINALARATKTCQWTNIQTRVRQFAEIVGYQRPSEDDAERDVFTYINYLYGKAVESTNNQQIAALEAKVAILTREKENYLHQSRTQNRIIANLSLRHILERLPPHSSKHEKASWDKFWKDAVDQAMGDENSPLSKLIDSYARPNDKNPQAPRNVEYIRKVGGADLYSALSTNIHQFKGEYILQRDQWHTLEWEILKVIEPLPENVFADGTVDWGKERERFIPPQPASSSAPAQSSTPASSSAPISGAIPASISAPTS